VSAFRKREALFDPPTLKKSKLVPDRRMRDAEKREGGESGDFLVKAKRERGWKKKVLWVIKEKNLRRRRGHLGISCSRPG